MNNQNNTPGFDKIIGKRHAKNALFTVTDTILFKLWFLFSQQRVFFTKRVS